MDLILFGRQGSGKGTQGKVLAERYGLTPFVTGDELRRLANEPSELGKKVKSIIEAGHLVPNDVVMEIIENFMNNLPGGSRVLFDGIPRKMEQAESFDALMKKLGRDFTGVVIELDEESAVKRLTTRRVCETCKAVYPADFKGETCETITQTGRPCGGKLTVRSDDANMESIQNRLTAYRKETVPVIEHYRALNKIISINGQPAIEEVTKTLLKQLDSSFLA